MTTTETTETSFSRIKASTYGKVFGKTGIFRTSTNLIAGRPGVGKTTFLLQLLDEIAGVEKRKVIFSTTEEDGNGIYELAERLHLKNGELIVIRHDPDESSNLAALVIKTKPAALVIDSLEGLVGTNKNAVDTALQLASNLSQRCRCPIFISHSTNVGSDLKGYQLDSISELTVKNENTRVIKVQKNRFDRAFVSQTFQFGSKGFAA